MSAAGSARDTVTREFAARAQVAARWQAAVLGVLFALLGIGVAWTVQDAVQSELQHTAAQLDAVRDAVAEQRAGSTMEEWLVAAVEGAPVDSPHGHFGVRHGVTVAASAGLHSAILADPEVRAVVAGPALEGWMGRVTVEGGDHLVLLTPLRFGEETGWYGVTSIIPSWEVTASDALIRYGTIALAAFAAAVGLSAVFGSWYVHAPLRRLASEPSERAGEPLRVVVAEGFLSRLAFGLLSFSLPLFAFNLGMSFAEIGVLLTVNTAVAIVLKPLMGRLIDVMGVRTGYVVAVAIRTLVVLSLVFAISPVHLFAARALHGVSIALRDPAASTVLAALGGKKAVAQRFAWYQTAKTVAGSTGQVAAGILLTLWLNDFATVFTLATILSGIPLLLVMFGLRGPAVRGLRVKRKKGTKTPLPAALKASLAPYALLGATMTGTAYLMSNLLPIMAVEHMGLTPAAASSMYALTAVVSVTGPAWGWVADRVSLKLVLGVRAVGNIASSLIWLFVPTHPGLIAGKAADDVGKAAFRPAWGAVMARVSALDPTRRTQTLALMSTAEDVGELGAPIIAGLIWSTFGLPALLMVRAGAGVATEVYALWLGSRGLLVEPVDADEGDGHEETLTSDSSPAPAGSLR